MRVIAGEKRHLLLKTLDSLDIRPTTDKIKETLFNMIQFDIAGKNFLDLFAGSGAIGIEALSRGAKSACFIDNNQEAIKIIKYNLEHTGLIEKAEILNKDARLALENLSRKKNIYGIVFLDPPYGKGLHLPVLKSLYNSNLINNDTIIIYETEIKDDGEGIEDIGYEITKIKKYKTNKHIFIRK